MILCKNPITVLGELIVRYSDAICLFLSISMRLYLEIHLSFYIRTFIKVLFICNILTEVHLNKLKIFGNPI